MAHDAMDLRVRTKKFALRIIKLYQNLPKKDRTTMQNRNSVFVILHSSL
jgi:hypothetical protein